MGSYLFRPSTCLWFEDVAETWLKGGSRPKTALRNDPQTPPHPISSHISLKVKVGHFFGSLKPIESSTFLLDWNPTNTLLLTFYHILEDQYCIYPHAPKP